MLRVKLHFNQRQACGKDELIIFYCTFLFSLALALTYDTVDFPLTGSLNGAKLMIASADLPTLSRENLLKTIFCACANGRVNYRCFSFPLQSFF